MAFFSRAGSILRQTVSKHINHETSVTNPSIFQFLRCMSGGIPSSKVFVGGLAWATDDMSLREAFTAYGEVYEARVIMDRETGRSRGFGFVTFANSETASAAIQAMDQRELHGRTVSVHYANERPQFGGGGGNYGGGRYGGGGGDNYGGGRYGGGDSGYGQNSYGGDVSGNSGYGQNSYGGDVSGNSGYGGNNYGSGGDVAGSGGNWGNNYGSGGGENQNFGGGWNNGNANGNADGPVEGSYMDNDEPDEFAKRA